MATRCAELFTGNFELRFLKNIIYFKMPPRHSFEQQIILMSYDIYLFINEKRHFQISSRGYGTNSKLHDSPRVSPSQSRREVGLQLMENQVSLVEGRYHFMIGYSGPASSVTKE